MESVDCSGNSYKKQDKVLRERHMAQPGRSIQEPQESWNKTKNNLKISELEVSENEKCSWL